MVFGLPEAKARATEPGRFMLQRQGGRCEACEGDGVLKIEMHFSPDVYVTCDSARQALQPRTLDVTFKTQSIADVLRHDGDGRRTFFQAVPRIRNVLRPAAGGLGYIHVASRRPAVRRRRPQRVKLAKELSKRATGRTSTSWTSPPRATFPRRGKAARRAARLVEPATPWW